MATNPLLCYGPSTVMIDLATAKVRIDPIEPILISAAETATSNWFSEIKERPAFARPLTSRSRANIIHDHFCLELEAGVEGIPGVFASDALGFFVLTIGSGVLLRPKYLGQGTPSNVATIQQKQLARQEFTEENLGCLGLMAPPTLLTVGYTLGDGELGHIEIRRECKGVQLWKYEIYGGDASAEPLVFPGLEDDLRPAAIKSNREVAEKGQTLADEAR